MCWLWGVFEALLKRQLCKRPVVVASIVDVAAARVNEALGATVFGKIVHVGFPVVARGQATFAVLKIVAADHHTERGQRVEIPFCECIAGLCLVQAFAFAFVDII